MEETGKRNRSLPKGNTSVSELLVCHTALLSGTNMSLVLKLARPRLEITPNTGTHF
jgi:hypothetical protein